MFLHSYLYENKLRCALNHKRHMSTPCSYYGINFHTERMEYHGMCSIVEKN